MITEDHGNLLQSHTEAIVNTVNTVGIMGKGIALQFKRAYPGNFKAYERACKAGEVQIGRMLVFDTQNLGHGRYIINFPTKRHWRAASKLRDIEAGLDDLVRVIRDYGIRSIALPPLGCGNGGLDWSDVRPLIATKLAVLDDVDVRIFPPEGAPAAETMPVRTKRPNMSPGRSALIRLLARYADVSRVERMTEVNGASLLEIQKLAYFMQETGANLRLAYVKGTYGPYADNLNKVLATIEGHYTVGYGDGTAGVLDLAPIVLMPNAVEEAELWARDAGDPLTAQIDRVVELAEGFTGAYGMELLSSVHFVAHHDEGRAATASEAAEIIRHWNARKGRLLTPGHVAVAWEHLASYGWLAVA